MELSNSFNCLIDISGHHYFIKKAWKILNARLIETYDLRPPNPAKWKKCCVDKLSLKHDLSVYYWAILSF